jgi:hypothetical protein
MVKVNQEVNPLWDMVWKLQVPGKVKIFLWKALHVIVHRMTILAARHIKVHPQCALCRVGPKDMKHLLFSCIWDRQVWDSLGVIQMMDEAFRVDRLRSVILERILCDQIKLFSDS